MGSSPRGVGSPPRDLGLGLSVVLGVVLGSLVLPAAPLAGGPDPAPVIDRPVQDAAAKGDVRVIVELRISEPATAEPHAPQAVAGRRKAIAAVQATVLSRLVGSRFRLIRQYATVPFLALEIDSTALAALERMGDVVVRVSLDSTLAPSQRGALRSGKPREHRS